MLVAARDAGVARFVYAASSSTYGDHPGLPKVEDAIGRPLSPYAVTKYVDELYADVFGRCYGTATVGLRYFNVFGARQDPEGAYAAVIPRWVDAMLRGSPVVIHGDGETTRDFCYVANVVEANLLAATTVETAAHQSDLQRRRGRKNVAECPVRHVAIVARRSDIRDWPSRRQCMRISVPAMSGIRRPTFPRRADCLGTTRPTTFAPGSRVHCPGTRRDSQLRLPRHRGQPRMFAAKPDRWANSAARVAACWIAVRRVRSPLRRPLRRDRRQRLRRTRWLTIVAQAVAYEHGEGVPRDYLKAAACIARPRAMAIPRRNTAWAGCMRTDAACRTTTPSPRRSSYWPRPQGTKAQ